VPRIDEEIVIGAPPQRVWEILVDFPAHQEWNPFLRFDHGSTVVGERLAIQITLPGRDPMRFQPRLVACEPQRRYAWLGRAPIPKLFDGQHEFGLDPVPDGTRLRQFEVFRGILPPLMRSTLRQTRAGFALMNAALKERAEQG